MRFASVFPRWVSEGGRRIAGQVFVSLAATGAVALMSTLFLKEPAAPVPARADADAHSTELAVLNLLKAGFAPAGARARTIYPSEFEAIALPAFPVVVPATPTLVLAAEAAPARSLRKPQAATVAAGCGASCAVAPPRPVLAEAPAAIAEATREARAPEPMRLLGVPLPGFVPEVGETLVNSGALIVRSGQSAAKSAFTLGSNVVEMATRIIP